MSKENTLKRVPKGNIRFKIKLSEEQKKAKEGIYEKDLSIVIGRAASGKTALAVLTALDFFFKRKVNKIIISRPIVKNSVGYLPGEIEDKLAPHVYPVKHCMYEAYGREKIDKMFTEGDIEIIPIDFMKGVTYTNSFVIIDEFEDLTMEEFELCLTRLGKDSKLVFTGAEEQIDKSIKNSCISKVKCLKDCDLVNYVKLTENHRNNIIFDVLNYIKKH